MRPTATLGDYKGLEVGRARGRASTSTASTHELEHLREHLARLETVERAAGEGDFVVVDYDGSIDGEPFEGGEGRDQLIELGGGRLIPGFEEQLSGASAGEERTIDVTFPDDYGAEPPRRQRRPQFAISVKEVRARVLPELDDELASDAAGFDTLDELRRTTSADGSPSRSEQSIESEFREAVLDAAVANADRRRCPSALVEARAVELWDQMLALAAATAACRSEAYLQISGRTEEEILEEAKPDAEQALKREAVLAAVVAAESIEPSRRRARSRRWSPPPRARTRPAAKLLERVKKTGTLDALREDVATTQGDRPAGRAREAVPGRAGRTTTTSRDARQRSRGRRRASQKSRERRQSESQKSPPRDRAARARARRAADSEE